MSQAQTAERFDVIVVGAGPAELSAASLLGKAGLNVAVIERGDFPGSKNVMGGELYRQPTAEVFPEVWKQAPLERTLVEQRAWVLTEKAVFKVGHRHQAFGEEPYNAFTVLRARFDKWVAQQVREAGVLIIPETVVEEPILEGEKVVGVRTGRPDGDLYANVVIAADGVTSLLAQKAGPPMTLRSYSACWCVAAIRSAARPRYKTCGHATSRRLPRRIHHRGLTHLTDPAPMPRSHHTWPSGQGATVSVSPA